MRKYMSLIWISSLFIVVVIGWNMGRIHERREILNQMEAPVSEAVPVVHWKSDASVLMKQIEIDGHWFVLAPMEEYNMESAGLRYGGPGYNWQLTAIIKRHEPVTLPAY